MYALGFATSISLAMQPNQLALPVAKSDAQVTLIHKKRSAAELFAPCPPEFIAKPIVQVNALLEQDDTFSCAYRSLFHAQCFTLALQKVKLGYSFEESLKKFLLNHSLLDTTFDYVKEYLDQYYPTHDKASGLCLHHILGVCAASIPLLHTKLLPIFLEDDKKIYVLHDPTPALPSPLHYSADFICQLYPARYPAQLCQTNLDSSAELTHQLAKLKTPGSIAHFVCKFPCHLFVASIITDEYGYAKLYVIDSNNNNISTHESFRLITTQILAYVQLHNSQLSQQFKKQKKDK